MSDEITRQVLQELEDMLDNDDYYTNCDHCQKRFSRDALQGYWYCQDSGVTLCAGCYDLRYNVGFSADSNPSLFHEKSMDALRAELATANKVIDGFQDEMTRQAKVIVAQGEVIEALEVHLNIEHRVERIRELKGRVPTRLRCSHIQAIEKEREAKAKLEEAQRGDS